MKQTHKKSNIHIGKIDISVGKYRWISYNGNRINYGLIVDHAGGREKLIQFLQEHSPSHHSPPGFYGGNIPKISMMDEPMALLRKLGLNSQLLKKNIRFFVTIGGTAAPDTNPNPRTHEIDWKQCHGFETRAEANKAARSRFEYYKAWCRDDSGKKRTSIVTLKLYDKDNNLIEENRN